MNDWQEVALKYNKNVFIVQEKNSTNKINYLNEKKPVIFIIYVT